MEDKSRQQDTFLNILGQSFGNVLNTNMNNLVDNENDQSRIDDGSHMNLDGSNGGNGFFNQIIRMVDENIDKETKRSILTSINSILGDNYHQDDIKNALEISKGLFDVKENTDIGRTIECMQRNIKDPNCLKFDNEETLTTFFPTFEELELTPRVEASQWSSVANEFLVSQVNGQLSIIYSV